MAKRAPRKTKEKNKFVRVQEERILALQAALERYGASGKVTVLPRGRKG